jgi:hypothetical protein
MVLYVPLRGFRWLRHVLPLSNVARIEAAVPVAKQTFTLGQAMFCSDAFGFRASGFG